MRFIEDIDMERLPDQQGYLKVQNWEDETSNPDDYVMNPRLLIVGSSGTGKTWAAAAKLDSICEGKYERYKCNFLTFPRFNLLLNQNTACKGCKILESYLEDMCYDGCAERVEDGCRAYDMMPGNYTVIDDLQEWNTKQALTFLKKQLDESTSIVTLQTPEVFDIRTLKAWLTERLSGYKGTLQLDAEAVVRRLFEPKGLTIVEMKKNK